MFNGNYININRVIDSLQDYPFMEGLSKRESATKLVSLLGLIGAIMPLERKYEVLEVKQHKGILPTDIMFIAGVNNKGNHPDNRGVAMRYASDIYNSVLHSDSAKAACSGTTLTEAEASSLFGSIELEEGESILAAEFAPQKVYASGVVNNSYTLNGVTIDTSFESGYVEIAYDSVKTDSEGYPMVPDNKSFIEAFKYYLLKGKAEPEFFRGKISQAAYSKIEQQYAFYVGQAGNSFNMPSPDQMEMMIQGLIRILPHSNNVTDGWKSFNKPNY